MEESSKSLQAKLIILIMLPLILSLSEYHSPLLPGLAAAGAQGTPKMAVNPGRIADLGATVGKHEEFAVNLTDAPAINGFSVILTYNFTVLHALSVDYVNVDTVLKSTGQGYQELRNCVDNSGVNCQPNDAQGVVSLALSVLGAKETTPPTSGSLFKVQFNVTRQGFTQIHIQNALLSAPVVNSDGSITITNVGVVTTDGFFSNVDCPGGSHVACEPPTPIFAFSPSQPLEGDVVLFNASLSHGPTPNTKLTRFFWFWGEPSSSNFVGSTEYCTFVNSEPGPYCKNGKSSLPLNSTAAHEFMHSCKCPVTLTVTDTDGISWSVTVIVVVIRSLVDLEAQDIQADHANLVTPGTVVTVKATVKNIGTVALNGTIQIILEAGHGQNKTLGTPLSFLNLGPNAFRETSATWDTGGYNPKVYRIDAIVPVVAVNATLYENVTSNNVKSTWIQLIKPFSAGLSLDLLSSTGVGILVVLGGGFAVSWARRRRPPSDAL